MPLVSSADELQQMLDASPQPVVMLTLNRNNNQVGRVFARASGVPFVHQEFASRHVVHVVVNACMSFFDARPSVCSHVYGNDAPVCWLQTSQLRFWRQ